MSGDIVINSGDSLVVDGHGGPKIKLVITPSGTLVNNGDINLTLDGILVNNSTFSNTGTVVNSRFIENSGTINNDGGEISGGAITNTGTLDNTGTIITGSSAINGGIVNSGTVTNTGYINAHGPIFNKNSGIFINAVAGLVNFDTDEDLRNDDETGTIHNFGTISGDGDISAGKGTFINNGGTINGGIGVSQAGTFTNTNSGTLVINKTSNIHGTLVNTNSSAIHNFAISLYITNTGTVDNSSIFKNQRVIFNNGTINNSGLFENTGTLYNDCSGVINGTITGNPPVNNCNDPPVAFDQLVSTDVNTSISFKLNATDADSTGLTYSIVTPPHGVLSGTAPDIIYTPAANFVGVDSFTFQVNDGELDSNIAQVSIIINDLAAPSTGNNGMIAFTRVFGGNDDIFIMNADGMGQVNMTSTLGYFESYPTWSPDGTEVAYAAHKTGCSTSEAPCNSIVAVKADGMGLRTITNSTVGAADLAWSPDGAKIAFTGAGGISVVDANGGDAELLVPGGQDPSWSPDGMKIVFMKNTGDGNREISVINADGTNEVQLTNNPDVRDNYFAPDWSPDGIKIAFARATPGELDVDFEWQIYVMNADGTNHVRLTEREENVMGATDPSWSPDGKKIVFTKLLGHDGRVPAIAIMNADGTNQTLLTRGDDYAEVSPDFGPAPAAPPSEEKTYCNDMTIDELIASGQYNVIDNRDGRKKALRGTSGADLILAGARGDAINGRGGNDCIIGGAGNDRIEGGNGDDILYAGAGNDRIEGARGNDYIDGGDGTDRCHDRRGTNTVVNCEDRPRK